MKIVSRFSTTGRVDINDAYAKIKDFQVERIMHWINNLLEHRRYVGDDLVHVVETRLPVATRPGLRELLNRTKNALAAEDCASMRKKIIDIQGMIVRMLDGESL